MGPREVARRSTFQVTAGDGSRVTIHVFPHDARFVRDIHRALDAIGASPPSEGSLRDRLEAGLRAWYPRLELRRRDDLAQMDEDDRHWYAMRDGHVSRPSDRTDRLHAVMSDARITSATSSAVMEQAQATIARASRPRGREVLDDRGATATAVATESRTEIEIDDEGEE